MIFKLDFILSNEYGPLNDKGWIEKDEHDLEQHKEIGLQLNLPKLNNISHYSTYLKRQPLIYIFLYCKHLHELLFSPRLPVHCFSFTTIMCGKRLSRRL